MGKWALALVLVAFSAARVDARKKAGAGTGKPCGNSWIAAWKTCHIGSGSPAGADHGDRDPPSEERIPRAYLLVGTDWMVPRDAVACRTVGDLGRRFSEGGVGDEPEPNCVPFGDRASRSARIVSIQVVNERVAYEIADGAGERFWLLREHLGKPVNGGVSPSGAELAAATPEGDGSNALWILGGVAGGILLILVATSD